MPNWKKLVVSGSDATLNTLTLSNSGSTADTLLLTATEDSSTAAPVITLKRNSASPADADYLGQIKFKGENDADQEQVYAKITGKIQDASDGSEDGLIEFANVKAGSNTITARLKSDKLQLLNGTTLEVDGQVSASSLISNNFSGSFQGDGSGLTGVSAAGTLSSSAQIADDISGSLSVTALNSVSPGIVSGSAQVVSALDNQNLDLGTGNLTVDGVADFNGNITGLGNFFVNASTLLYNSSGATITFATNGTVNIGQSGNTSQTTEVNGASLTVNAADTTLQDAQIDSLGIGTAASGTTGQIRATGQVSASSFISNNFSGSFQGDGSSLTGINTSIVSSSTVSETFTNATTHSVTHTLGTKDLIVNVYDSNDDIFVPTRINTPTTSSVVIYMDPATSGRVVIGKSGHVVSGSSFSGSYSGSFEGLGSGLTNVTSSKAINTRDNSTISFWQGSQAQYDALGSYDSNVIYFTT